ncbi:hypothetical protein Ahy_B04g070483 [Arachis hypogaea]|uniref:RNase H type-1 domain-containing protein n=1 Tax=Arachis hypogaea TaxID=3818 RepID=A0A444ZH62_ARAHY|nr:hypothetical protein Ahy_B04g070483 [Arachis hypogaea]
MEIEFVEIAEESSTSSTMKRRSVRRATWRPPLARWVKYNIDASFVEVHFGGATTAILRDHTKNLFTDSNSKIAATSPFAAKALAVREALIMAKTFKKRIIIEFDSLILIQALKPQASIVEIQVILDDILDLARSISNCGFT